MVIERLTLVSRLWADLLIENLFHPYDHFDKRLQVMILFLSLFVVLIIRVFLQLFVCFDIVHNVEVPKKGQISVWTNPPPANLNAKSEIILHILALFDLICNGNLLCESWNLFLSSHRTKSSHYKFVCFFLKKRLKA